MKKEKSVTLTALELPGRLTRSQAASCSESRQFPPLKVVTQQNQKQSKGANPKRPVSDNTRLGRKRRSVLRDVTNISCENTYSSSFNATKIQSDAMEQSQIQLGSNAKGLPEIGLRSEDVTCSVNLQHNALDSQTPGISAQTLISQKKVLQIVEAKKGNLSGAPNIAKDPDVTDIDAGFEDPIFCTIYVVDIYDNLRVAELSRRPYPHFMETVQQDITQTMRGLLVDWLVEVSEEYKLVPDTLYLSIYLIDWFLSKNCIERQRLQLLGITCMLIASKYEEINAPRIEEFCLITDNTYTKEEVLKMEIQVLKSVAYQLFAPTTKTFLRRFLRAAQASYPDPIIDLECLGNYLAELTLMNYDFLNFLPSMIAASAVFLAGWTLDQSSHPWNPTLQHYTGYKASDLKSTVLALRDMQLNTDGCPLITIRTKYRQEKFKCVAALSSSKLQDAMFRRQS
ncbi:PREDICTED: cyclin-A2-4-like isoform X2 [Lupinus angustifolius]|uniref:cyclin-A2-4-like isoform X2 n=1 Tax=Lupinus angustifolius TaxID=3871 RepID=UPI00092F7CFC|nr:PREDICTED: cyclin-A2-4-like isoform X2 [Lupinus angustifolius]